jgi:hypothetical protein
MDGLLNVRLLVYSRSSILREMLTKLPWALMIICEDSSCIVINRQILQLWMT